jgi:hypothetical protein
MAKNIKTQYKNGRADSFLLESDDNLRLHSMLFNKEEEAEFAVALARLLKAHGHEDYSNETMKAIPYIFRMIGIESAWAK